MKSKWVEQLIVTNALLSSHRHRALLAPCCPMSMSMPPVVIENFHLSRYRSVPLAKPGFILLESVRTLEGVRRDKDDKSEASDNA